MTFKTWSIELFLSGASVIISVYISSYLIYNFERVSMKGFGVLPLNSWIVSFNRSVAMMFGIIEWLQSNINRIPVVKLNFRCIYGRSVRTDCVDSIHFKDMLWLLL